jgi:hypothetical protein
MSNREGPRVEIQRGDWEDRLQQIDAVARAELRKVETPEAPRWALVVESTPESGKILGRIKPLLGDDVLTIQARETPVKISSVLQRLKDANDAEPLVGVCVIGTGDREDARKAGWDLGKLATRPWVFAHTSVPPSGLVPTIGEKVVRFLEIIDGIAFMEGPKASRRGP